MPYWWNLPTLLKEMREGQMADAAIKGEESKARLVEEQAKSAEQKRRLLEHFSDMAMGYGTPGQRAGELAQPGGTAAGQALKEGKTVSNIAPGGQYHTGGERPTQMFNMQDIQPGQGMVPGEQQALRRQTMGLPIQLPEEQQAGEWKKIEEISKRQEKSQQATEERNRQTQEAIANRTQIAEKNKFIFSVNNDFRTRELDLDRGFRTQLRDWTKSWNDPITRMRWKTAEGKQDRQELLQQRRDMMEEYKSSREDLQTARMLANQELSQPDFKPGTTTPSQQQGGKKKEGQESPEIVSMKSDYSTLTPEQKEAVKKKYKELTGEDLPW